MFQPAVSSSGGFFSSPALREPVQSLKPSTKNRRTHFATVTSGSGSNKWKGTVAVKDFTSGFIKGVGGFVAAGICAWLSTRVPQWREPVIDFFFGLVPQDQLVWPVAVVLFVFGLQQLVIAHLSSEACMWKRVANGEPTVGDLANLGTMRNEKQSLSTSR